MVKQVIVWRKDLKVRKGKFAAQVAHASMKVFFDRMSGLRDSYPDELQIDFTTEMIEWIEGKFTKIVVGCNSLEELLELQKRAEEAGLANAIIEDSGATEFKMYCPECLGYGCFESTNSLEEFKCKTCKGTGKVSKPTITCLAIGPAQAEAIDEITGKLELL